MNEGENPPKMTIEFFEDQKNLKVNLAIILKITLEDQAHSISQKEFLKRLGM